MGLLLVLQQLMRLALVDVLIILAPLAAVCWILPRTHGWGRLWGSLFVGTMFVRAVQVLALRLGFNLTTDMPPATASGLIQPLLGSAVLAVVLKIPGPGARRRRWRQPGGQSDRHGHRCNRRRGRQPACRRGARRWHSRVFGRRGQRGTTRARPLIQPADERRSALRPGQLTAESAHVRAAAFDERAPLSVAAPVVVGAAPVALLWCDDLLIWGLVALAAALSLLLLPILLPILGSGPRCSAP
jgi:hypothetical protein